MLPFLLLLACRAPEQDNPRPAVHETLSVASDLADEARLTWAAEDLGPGWIQTVYAFGWHRLYQASGDPAHQAYYRDWMEVEHLDYEGPDPREFTSSDSMALSSIAVILMIEDPSLDYEAVVAAADTYLDGAPRVSNGAIAHWGVQGPFAPTDEVWIDSQFMFGMYLLRQLERTGDADYHDQFVDQYVLFSELCRHETDLYFHAWDDSESLNIPDEPTFWTRGNSWVLVAAAEYLTLFAEGGPFADQTPDPRIEPLFVAQAEAFLAVQEDGLWLTVANSPRGDDPANYLETSGSALVAYALLRGMRAGVLDEATYGPAISDAVDGVLANVVEEDGGLTVTGTSVGTNPGDYDYYVAVPTLDDLMLGIGAVMIFLAEVDGEEVR